jgi:DNA mismatch endonuclease (patch repair protein)
MRQIEPLYVPEQRWSALMARVRQRDTSPELSVRRCAHNLGFRFRLHRKDLPGTPDIVFPKSSKVIFVHGCFWHRHPGCKYATFPKSRPEFWHEKFEQNTKRDIRINEALSELGWQTFTIWECQTRDPALLECLLKRFLVTENAPLGIQRPRSSALRF